MRITNSMLNTQLVKNLRNSYTKLDRLQRELATGKKIHRPGDDPVGLGYLMRYNSEYRRNEEYITNAQMADGWLRQMDSVLQQAHDVFKRARVLTQQGATGTTPDDARAGIAAEIQQLLEQLVDLGNSDFDGRYMFNGQKTDVPPYDKTDPAASVPDTGSYNLTVAPGVTVEVNISGADIFGEAGHSTNAFQVLQDVYDHLQANDTAQLTADLTRIDEAMDRISLQLSETGARMNRFELVENRINNQQDNIEILKSNVNDVDMAEVITDIKMQESVHQAALATGVRVLQPTLVDFLQ